MSVFRYDVSNVCFSPMTCELLEGRTAKFHGWPECPTHRSDLISLSFCNENLPA
jgi:hypothetical protein